MLEDPRADALGQTEHMDRADNDGLDGLDRIELVVPRGGGTGQVVDLIYFDVERVGHIVAKFGNDSRCAMFSLRPVK
jgi:hypothetical protein